MAKRSAYSIQIMVTAPPGYGVTYLIEWLEVSQTGVVAVQRGDEITYLEVSVGFDGGAGIGAAGSRN